MAKKRSDGEGSVSQRADGRRMARLSVGLMQVVRHFALRFTDQRTRKSSRSALGKKTEKLSEKTGERSEEAQVESALRKSAREGKEAVEAQKAENAKQDTIIGQELQRRSSLGAFGVISDELARAIAKRIAGTIKLQIKQFDLFIKDLRVSGMLDDATIRGIKDNLISAWNAGRDKFGLDPATDAGFDDAMSDTVDVDIEQMTRGSTPGLGAAITPEMLRAAGNIVVGEIRLGAKRFSVLIKNLRAEFDDTIVNHLKPTLIAMWNANQSKYGLDDATPELFDDAMKLELEEDPELPVAMTKPPATPSKTLEAVPSDSPSKYLPPQPKPHSYPNMQSAMLDRIVSWKLIVIFSVASVCWTYWLCNQPAQFQYESFGGNSEMKFIKQINTKTGEVKSIYPKVLTK